MWMMQGFDEHLNMVLADAEETHTSTELDAAGHALQKVRHTPPCEWCEVVFQNVWVQQEKRNFPMLFLRGDNVILVTPPIRTAWGMRGWAERWFNRRCTSYSCTAGFCIYCANYVWDSSLSYRMPPLSSVSPVLISIICYFHVCDCKWLDLLTCEGCWSPHPHRQQYACSNLHVTAL